jgi:tetratricopeptide (TPR) repeat protein
MISRALRSIALSITVCCAPSFARAQEASGATEIGTQSAPAEAAESEITTKARKHFQKGVDYYGEGDLVAAMVEFKRAYDIEPTFRLLYNIAQVAYEQRDYAAAERYFKDYLAEGKTQIEIERRIEVERELERLRGRVANVSLHSSLPNAQLFVDEQLVGREPLPKAVRVSAGRRTVRAELPGHVPVRRVIDVVGGEAQRVELVFLTPLDQRYAESDPSYSRDEPSSRGLGPALWTGLATGVLAAGTVGMAIWTQSEQSDYDAAVQRETTRTELDRLSDSTEQKALITDVLLGATVVAGVITVVLLLTDEDSAERATASAIERRPDAMRLRF